MRKGLRSPNLNLPMYSDDWFTKFNARQSFTLYGIYCRWKRENKTESDREKKSKLVEGKNKVASSLPKKRQTLKHPLRIMVALNNIMLLYEMDYIIITLDTFRLRANALSYLSTHSYTASLTTNGNMRWLWSSSTFRCFSICCLQSFSRHLLLSYPILCHHRVRALRI